MSEASLTPNTEETNTEEGSKSDYYSDEGDLKADTTKHDSGSQILVREDGGSKLEETRVDENEKSKNTGNESEKTSVKLNGKPIPEEKPNEERVRAGSVASDNSDEFVDAMESVAEEGDKLSGTETAAKMQESSGKSISVRRSIKPSSVRLPTFADDNSDAFPSFLESDSTKNSSAESKTVRKVKLNRSKFLNIDKAADTSSSRVTSPTSKAEPPKGNTVIKEEGKISPSTDEPDKSENARVLTDVLPPVTQPAREEKEPLVTPFVTEEKELSVTQSAPEEAQLPVIQSVAAEEKEPPAAQPVTEEKEEEIPVAVEASINDGVPAEQQHAEKESITETKVSVEKTVTKDTEPVLETATEDTNDKETCVASEAVHAENEVAPVQNETPDAEAENTAADKIIIDEQVADKIHDKEQTEEKVIGEKQTDKESVSEDVSEDQPIEFVQAAFNTDNKTSIVEPANCAIENLVHKPVEEETKGEESNAEEIEELEHQKKAEDTCSAVQKEELEQPVVELVQETAPTTTEPKLDQPVEPLVTEEAKAIEPAKLGVAVEEAEPVVASEKVPVIPKEVIETSIAKPKESETDILKNLETEIPVNVINEEESTTNKEEAMNIDVSNEILSKPKELSKLEQALIGKPLKKLEVQIPTLKEEFINNTKQATIGDAQPAPPVAEEKEKVKLRLSVQGDKVRIKKTSAVSVAAAAAAAPDVPAANATPATGEVRIKRQYKKRKIENKEVEKEAKGPKAYKLRNRIVKQEDAAPSAEGKAIIVPAKPGDEAGVTNERKESSLPAEKLSAEVVPVVSAGPVIIEKGKRSRASSVSAKVQPIKLKISKNSNVTIECTPPYNPVAQEKHIAQKADNTATVMMEEVRKANNGTSNNTVWSSDPDIQRVERFLKESSNVTITPIASKDASSQASDNSILKPILTAAKEMPQPPPAPAPAPPLPPPPATPPPMSSVGTMTVDLPPLPETPPGIPNLPMMPGSRLVNFNVGLDRLDMEEEIRGFKISRPPNSLEISPMAAAMANKQQVDVKSEIRKKIVSAEKRKLELPQGGSPMEFSGGEESPLGGGKMMMPGMLGMNADVTPLSFPLCMEGESMSDGAGGFMPTDINAALVPLLQSFPKKRGRPTKAMVAARNALKLCQEAALENLRILAERQSVTGESPIIDGAPFDLSQLPIALTDITDPSFASQVVEKGLENALKSRRVKRTKAEKSAEKSERSDSNDFSSSAEDNVQLDPAEEMKRLEDERTRREEERERKNEIRRKKAKERNDMIRAKRLRQKQKAEERQKRVQERKRMLQEQKKKIEEQIKNLPTNIGYDDDTRMSAENSQAQMLSYGISMAEDDSSNATTEIGVRGKKGRMEVSDTDSKDLTVDQIAEYQWPIQGGELYMIQEQVTNFLGVKSFKRKYPDIKRRPVDSEERAYLVDSGLVSESLCDLGLTAVCSAEVLDVMCADFSDKYEELRRYMREKQMKELSFKQRAWANGLGYKLLMADGSKQDLKKRAMESASNWNSALNKSRSEDRRCAMDLQTFIVHFPKYKTRKMMVETPKIGSYPISILPGQFCDYYKKYTATELRYMPVNTVFYGPLKQHSISLGDGSQTDSDDTSSSDESSSTTSEGTQATEDTLEDMDKDMTVDESERSQDSTMQSHSIELSENTRELMMDEASKILCKICLGNMSRNKENVPEVLICCSQCASTSHPTCLDLSLSMVPQIKKYAWQCPDCKVCARCKENADEDKMLFCDICDRGYHIYCVGLRKVPSGSWQCQECSTVADSMNNVNNIPSAAASAASVIAASVQAAAVRSPALATAVASVATEAASKFKEPEAVATAEEPMQEG